MAHEKIFGKIGKHYLIFIRLNMLKYSKSMHSSEVFYEVFVVENFVQPKVAKNVI